MAKWAIIINLVESYQNQVVVEAKNLDEAIKKVQAEWEADPYLYENTTDMMREQEVSFWKKGLASPAEIKYNINID